MSLREIGSFFNYAITELALPVINRSFETPLYMYF
jgi:hypothetical protein